MDQTPPSKYILVIIVPKIPRKLAINYIAKLCVIAIPRTVNGLFSSS